MEPGLLTFLNSLKLEFALVEGRCFGSCTVLRISATLYVPYLQIQKQYATITSIRSISNTYPNSSLKLAVLMSLQLVCCFLNLCFFLILKRTNFIWQAQGLGPQGSSPWKPLKPFIIFMSCLVRFGTGSCRHPIGSLHHLHLQDLQRCLRCCQCHLAECQPLMRFVHLVRSTTG